LAKCAKLHDCDIQNSLSYTFIISFSFAAISSSILFMYASVSFCNSASAFFLSSSVIFFCFFYALSHLAPLVTHGYPEVLRDLMDGFTELLPAVFSQGRHWESDYFTVLSIRFDYPLN
jgi:hypothetical protein